MLDATPLCVNILDRNYKNTECIQESLKLFEVHDKQEYIERFWKLQPEYQPDGSKSMDKAKKILGNVYEEGYFRFEWMHQKLDGQPVPCEVALVRVKHKSEYVVLAYKNWWEIRQGCARCCSISFPMP